MSFQSFNYLRPLGYDIKTKLYSYEYEITDSEFGREIVVSTLPEGEFEMAFEDIALPVIQLYSKRNLPVAKNLFFAMLYLERIFKYPIQEQITYYNKYIPDYFSKYEEKIKKYLTLI